MKEQELYKKGLKVLPMFKEMESKGFYLSASSIQRRFRVGYTVSAKVLERLEQEGYVTTFNGKEPRKVLKTHERQQ